MARYGGGSRQAELPMLQMAIVRSEPVVRDPHWKRRARMAAWYGSRVLPNRPFAEGNEQWRRRQW